MFPMCSGSFMGFGTPETLKTLSLRTLTGWPQKLFYSCSGSNGFLAFKILRFPLLKNGQEAQKHEAIASVHVPCRVPLWPVNWAVHPQGSKKRRGRYHSPFPISPPQVLPFLCTSQSSVEDYSMEMQEAQQMKLSIVDNPNWGSPRGISILKNKLCSFL